MTTLRDRKTGAGALAVTIEPSGAFQLEEVRLHLSGNGASENFTVALDALDGPEWDVNLATQSMNGITDYVYHPTRPKEFASGDKIVMALANSGRVTWGLEAIWKSI